MGSISLCLGVTQHLAPMFEFWMLVHNPIARAMPCLVSFISQFFLGGCGVVWGWKGMRDVFMAETRKKHLFCRFKLVRASRVLNRRNSNTSG
jgi:hypothetical protein